MLVITNHNPLVITECENEVDCINYIRRGYYHSVSENRRYYHLFNLNPFLIAKCLEFKHEDKIYIDKYRSPSIRLSAENIEKLTIMLQEYSGEFYIADNFILQRDDSVYISIRHIKYSLFGEDFPALRRVKLNNILNSL